MGEVEFLDQFLSDASMRFRTNEYLAEKRFACELQDVYIGKDGYRAEKILTGSSAEFSIDPLLSCIGDVDIMYEDNYSLACFEDIDAVNLANYEPFLWPATKVCRVTSSGKYPAYVTVRKTGLVRFSRIDTVTNKCVYEPYEPELLFPRSGSRSFLNCIDSSSKCVNKGPALNVYIKSNLCEKWNNIVDRDAVYCIRSPLWPPVAHEWPNRRRWNGWPDKKTISEIVDNGCHIVPVAHIDCSTDDYQWRISFSKAEITLIKNWSCIQKMAYHMLRYFAKRELIPKDWKNTDEILSMYSLKVLMLWQCEQKSSYWWYSKNIFELIGSLLQILLNWLLDGECKNYFITTSNLFAHQMNIQHYDIVVEKLTYFTDQTNLVEWMRVNYYMKLHEEENKTTDLSVEYHCSFSAYANDTEYKFTLIDSNMVEMIGRSHETAFFKYNSPNEANRSRAFCLKNIGLIEEIFGSSDSAFADYYIGHILLQVTTFYRTHGKHDNLLAMLCSLFSHEGLKADNFSVFRTIARKQYYKLAECILSGSSFADDTKSVLRMKLAKILIKKELELFIDLPHKTCKLCDVNRELVHLATLEFALQKYGSCSRYLKLLSHLKKIKRFDARTWINGRYICYLDQIALAVGLLSLIEHTKFGSKIQNHFIFPFSLNFLSKWLLSQVNLAYDNIDSLQYNQNNSSLKAETPADMCLLIVMKCKQPSIHTRGLQTCSGGGCTRQIISNQTDDMPVVSVNDSFADVLTKCAVVHLTEFYELLRVDEDLKNIKIIKAVSHYKALYWFKKGRYDIVLKICEDILEEEQMAESESLTSLIDYSDPLVEFMMPICFFPFQELFDSNVTCSMGLTFLINRCFYITPRFFKSSTETNYDYNPSFIRPIFIARYLTVQSLIKCGGKKEVIMLAFFQLSSKLFIENILHMLLTFKLEKLMFRFKV